MRTVKFVDLGRQYLALREEILASFDAISRQGAYILSDEVAEFERRFAALCGVRHAIAVGNGSDALLLPLLCLGIGQGDEVITAPNSFIASAWVIARTGARIVFADVGEDMNLDPACVERAVTPRTRALLPVHLTGRIARMDELAAIAARHQLHVVEDAAQAVGARYKGRRAGSFGLCAGFSLHPLKNLHVHGDGGVITTDDEELSEQLRKYRNHGLRNRNEAEFWGVNSRLDAVQAGIANIKMQHIEAWNDRLRSIARMYIEGLRDCVRVPQDAPHEEPVYHRFMIRHPKRDALQQFLESQGVETAIHYPIPLHLQPAALGLGCRRGDFPMAERLADTILSLPIYPELENDGVRHVIDAVRTYCVRNPMETVL